MRRAFSFRPRWWQTLLTLFFCALFLRLSVWQVHRYHEKLALQNAFTLKSAAPSIDFKQFHMQLMHKTDMRYTPVKLTGHFLLPAIFLLDNQMRGSAVGYHVLSLFELTKSHEKVLINRGWIPLYRRDILPNIPTPTQTLTLNTFSVYPPQKIIVLSSTLIDNQTWPMRIEAIDLQTIEHATHQTIFPMVFLLKQASPAGFLREWSPENLHATQSKVYAVQWVLFAVTLLIIYFILNFKRGK